MARSIANRFGSSLIVISTLIPPWGCSRVEQARPVAERPQALTKTNLMSTADLLDDDLAVDASRPVDASAAGLSKFEAVPHMSTVGLAHRRFDGGDEGGFRDFSAHVTIDPASNTVVSFEASIMADSVWADDPAMARGLASRAFLDTQRFAVCNFASTRIVKAPRGSLPRNANTVVTGKLTLRGVTREISFPADIRAESSGQVLLKSEFVIDRKDFGFAPSADTPDNIGDELRIRFALKAGQVS